jgi:tetratricopeptide (TPR) repeat protein
MEDTSGSGALGMNVDELLGEAIVAGRAGEREKALDLLATLVKIQPFHEQAWMWVAKLANDPIQKIEALEIILEINPENQAARRYFNLLSARQTQANQEFLTLAEARFQRGQQALQARDLNGALSDFAQAVELNPDHAFAWQRLGEYSIQLSEQITAYKNLLRLWPKESKIRRRLQALVRLQKDPLALGNYYAQRQLPMLAIEAYQHATATALTPAARLEAQRLRDDARIRLQIANYRGVNPWLTLARLSLGPMVFYALLVLIQAGLNPLHVSPLLCTSGVFVVLGSILLAATRDQATKVVLLHWLEYFQAGQAFLSLVLALLGFVLLFLPFLLILFDSLLRLRNLIL